MGEGSRRGRDFELVHLKALAGQNEHRDFYLAVSCVPFSMQEPLAAGHSDLLLTMASIDELSQVGGWPWQTPQWIKTI